MVETLTPVERDVLSIAAAGASNLEQIYLRLNQSARPTPLAETADAVRALISKGLLVTVANGKTAIAEDESLVWKESFKPTEEARAACMESVEKLDAPSRPSLFGIWKDRGITLKAEDLAEARREMWKNFPRDSPK